MQKTSKLELAIAAFREAGGILTMSEAMKAGIHRRELYALRDKGDLEVISRGLYRLVDMPDPPLPDFIPVAKKIPHGVICLISALAFHEITTQIPHFVYIALPSQAHKPAISHPPMRYFWYSRKLLSTGAQKHSIDGCTVMIFDVEKTLVAFTPEFYDNKETQQRWNNFLSAMGKQQIKFGDVILELSKSVIGFFGEI